MKWLLFLLAVVAVAFFVADTIAENTVERRVEERLVPTIEDAQGIEVDISGALFLPQLFGGSFDELDLTIDSVQREGLTVEGVKMTLRDVEFALGDLLANEGAVTVAGGRGRAVIAEGSLNAALQREGSPVEIVLDGTATLSASGRSAQVEDVSVSDGRLVFSAPPLEPLGLDLPATLAGIRYTGADVRGDHLLVQLRLRPGRVDL